MRDGLEFFLLLLINTLRDYVDDDWCILWQSNRAVRREGDNCGELGDRVGRGSLSVNQYDELWRLRG